MAVVVLSIKVRDTDTDEIQEIVVLESERRRAEPEREYEPRRRPNFERPDFKWKGTEHGGTSALIQVTARTRARA
jgi:hypothetical protein